MSITFFATQKDETTGHPMPMFSCDCFERWVADAEKAEIGEHPTPYACEVCDTEVNLGNTNAWELLRWLGIEPDHCGSIPARELAARCRRRLWDEPRNHDPALTADERAERLGVDVSQSLSSGARIVVVGREAGYLRKRTERLLKLAERAGDNLISWG